MNSHYSAHLAIFDDHGRILLVKRKDVPVWVIPGGQANKGETPLKTALREFEEETGVKMSSKEVRMVAEYTPVKRGNKHKYLFVSSRKKLRGIRTTSESSDFGFFPISDFPEVTPLYEQRKIHEAFLAISHSKLLRKDEVFFVSEIASLLKQPKQLIRLVSSYVKAKFLTRE